MPNVKVASTPTVAALDADARQRFDAWTTAKRAHEEYAARVAVARERLRAIPAALVVAAAFPQRLMEVQQERDDAERLLRDADAVLQGLEHAARTAGVEWGHAWTLWKNQLEAEMVPDFSAQHRALDEREAAARAAFEAKLAEMPTA
jgi:S-formylglutathione hydrolase FrmB